MAELKLCPFCGSEALLESLKPRKGFEAVIVCSNCLITMSSLTCDEEEEAIAEVTEAWNRRVDNIVVEYPVTHWMPLPEPPKGE